MSSVAYVPGFCPRGNPQATTTEFTFAPPSPFPESAIRLTTIQHIPPFMDGRQAANKRKDRPNPPALNLNDPVSFPRPASVAGSRANSPDSVKKPKTAHTKISQTKSMGKRRMSLCPNASLPSSPVIGRRISSTDPDRNTRKQESVDITHRMQERLSGRCDLYSSIALLLSKPITLRGQTHSNHPVANPGILEVSSQNRDGEKEKEGDKGLQALLL
ncbi:hypothetical protein BJ322DRAFT_1024698 [Thelephora terrestris]|uniref:Uncharacterized protein n=1 Tax=Thelephora terrestris TaxID=56493 RepID=A0A9P6L255_9AGAM|nr:hypothetical protein BJ322DRAFT_1024698 [Thelephora terrestris]